MEVGGNKTDVVQFVLNNYRIAAIEMPELYIYGVHQNNTWNPEHFEFHWQQSQLQFEGENYLKLLDRFTDRIPIHSYLQSLVSHVSTTEPNTTLNSDIGINIAGLTT
ncbi:MAG: hypothetical protein HC778_01400 [Chamaesiphon sp. CSU_1_12]|nr:hypothetical protein [Chamaesiphon sp. CSU_1_12]